MPFLAWIGSAFSASWGFVAADTTKKYAQLAAGIAAILVLAGVLKSAFDAAISSISAAAPTGAVAFGLSLLPSNTIACISVIFAALVASALYKFQRSFVLAKISGG